MSTHIMTASNEWATRPQDERFASLPELRTYLEHRESTLHHFEAKPGILAPFYDHTRRLPVLLDQDSLEQYELTNWSTGQLCKLAGVPQAFLSTLTPETASMVLRECWDKTATKRGDEPMKVQVSRNGRQVVRAITSERFDRVADLALLGYLDRMQDAGWRLAPARPNGDGPHSAQAKPLRAEDTGPWTFMREGEMGVPSGLYASDRDFFAFMIDAAHPIEEPGLGHALYRFAIVGNSEVGGGALSAGFGLFRGVCGNHILWDCQEFREIRGVHLGTGASSALNKMKIEATGFGDALGVSEFIKQAQALELAPTKEKLVEMLFARRILGKSESTRIVNVAEANEQQDGNPRSAWGIAQAITRDSQTGEGAQYANVRKAAEKPAEKVLALVGRN